MLFIFKKRAGVGGCVARENVLSVMKVIYWWSIVMIVLKHDKTVNFN